MITAEKAAAPVTDASGLQPEERARPKLKAESRSERFAFLGLVLATLALYGAPWIASAISTGFVLPPAFSSDFYTYLGFTHIFNIFEIAAHDPWYGMSIKPQLGHSLFRQAFALFGGLRSIFHLGDAATSILWCLAWMVLIGRGIWTVLRELLEGADALVLSATTVFLLFFGADSLPAELSAIMHPLNSGARNALTLPFMRMFFPQVSIPVIAFFLINASRAWTTNRWRNYWWMLVLQFVAFVMFPYATVLMILFAGIFVLLNSRQEHSTSRILRFIAIGVVAVVIDYSYLLLANPGGRRGAPTSVAMESILRPDLYQLRHLFGGTLVLLVMGSILLLLPRLRTSPSTLVASLGLANAGMLAADSLVNPSYLVSHHAGYFVQVSLGLGIVFLLHWSAQRFRNGAVFKTLFVSLLCVSIVNGVVAARATYVSHLAANSQFAAFAKVLQGLQLDSSDLVIAPADLVDDSSAVVPLVSSAKVLFARNAEILLDDQQRSEHAQRQAIYLYLSGRDADWVQGAIRQKEIPVAVLSLKDAFQIHEPGKRSEVETSVHNRLFPTLLKLQHENKSELLESYKRVAILDSAATPKFDDTRINSLLSVSADRQIDGIHVRVCKPR